MGTSIGSMRGLPSEYILSGWGGGLVPLSGGGGGGLPKLLGFLLIIAVKIFLFEDPVGGVCKYNRMG